ncbi:polysaccharide deacetylase family protein [Colwellia sp. MEBiC06753]
MKFSTRLFFLLICYFISIKVAVSAVILQYHHVSDETPDSTSISPTQFKVHLQYLRDNNFNVVPLSTIVDSIKQQQPLPDKTVAITFDDAYTNIYTNGKPLLDQFGYPYTVFVNPSTINKVSGQFMSWGQLGDMAKNRAIIANHGYDHHSLTRTPDGLSEDMWLAQYEHDLMKAESMLKENVGQSFHYFAYPYGEYTPAIQQWLTGNQFIGFSQQSGAVGNHTDLSAIPRFPASKPYDNMSSLRDKINSLPLEMSPAEQDSQTIAKFGEINSVTFDITVDDFNKSQLNCYVSGLGKQNIEWLSDSQFTINFNGDLPVGRIRCNCTAPSLEKSGRYYWYSKPWFILNKNNSWYPL